MTAGKPFHLFAVVLWALAVVYLVVVPAISWETYRISADIAHTVPGAALTNAAWRLFEGALYSAAELAAAGFVIELLDAIRWNLTRPEERRRRRGFGGDRKSA